MLQLCKSLRLDLVMQKSKKKQHRSKRRRPSRKASYIVSINLAKINFSISQFQQQLLPCCHELPRPQDQESTSSSEPFKLELDLDSDDDVDYESDWLTDLYPTDNSITLAHDRYSLRPTSLSSRVSSLPDNDCRKPTAVTAKHNGPNTESETRRSFFHILASDIEGLDTLGVGSGREWSAHGLHRIIKEHSYNATEPMSEEDTTVSACTEVVKMNGDTQPACMLSEAPWGTYYDTVSRTCHWVYAGSRR